MHTHFIASLSAPKHVLSTNAEVRAAWDAGFRAGKDAASLQVDPDVTKLRNMLSEQGLTMTDAIKHYEKTAPKVVQVYDSVNTSRHLGTIKGFRVGNQGNGAIFRMRCTELMSLSSFYGVGSTGFPHSSCPTATFTLKRFRGEPILTTSETLKTLASIPSFTAALK